MNFRQFLENDEFRLVGKTTNMDRTADLWKQANIGKSYINYNVVKEIARKVVDKETNEEIKSDIDADKFTESKIVYENVINGNLISIPQNVINELPKEIRKRQLGTIEVGISKTLLLQQNNGNIVMSIPVFTKYTNKEIVKIESAIVHEAQHVQSYVLGQNVPRIFQGETQVDVYLDSENERQAFRRQVLYLASEIQKQGISWEEMTNEVVEIISKMPINLSYTAGVVRKFLEKIDRNATESTGVMVGMHAKLLINKMANYIANYMAWEDKHVEEVQNNYMTPL